jgi:hypothetical protein
MQAHPGGAGTPFIEERVTMAESLAQRLIGIQKTLKPIEKTGQMKGGLNYKFLRAEEVFALFQSKLANAGVLIVPAITGDHAKEGNHDVTVYTLLFTVVNADDPEDKMLAQWRAEAYSKDDKGANKALFRSWKTFIAKLFLISDERDPEAAEAEEREKQATEFIARVQQAAKVIGDRAATNDEERRLAQIAKAGAELLPNFIFESGSTLSNLKAMAEQLKGD